MTDWLFAFVAAVGCVACVLWMAYVTLPVLTSFMGW